jgi:hypothetical protein
MSLKYFLIGVSLLGLTCAEVASAQWSSGFSRGSSRNSSGGSSSSSPSSSQSSAAPNLCTPTYETINGVKKLTGCSTGECGMTCQIGTGSDGGVICVCPKPTDACQAYKKWNPKTGSYDKLCQGYCPPKTPNCKSASTACACKAGGIGFSIPVPSIPGVTK